MTTQTTDTTKTLGAADRVHQALTTEPQTTAQIAEITGLSRSTVGKQLTALERDLKAVRHPGQQEGGGPRVADGWTKYTSGRLRPGGLDPLVLDYVNEQDQPVGPVAVARALGRSTGAVANCMNRLAKAGQLRLVNDKPRRYAGKPD
jgi:DNA-binding IclR family transcriptional regulator